MSNNTFPSTRPAGYDALIARYGLEVIPNWHRSAISSSSKRHSVTERGVVFDVYDRTLQPDDSLSGHIEFALKYDGINMEILSALFQKVDPLELVQYIQSKPTGRYTRRIWYLYELLTGRQLPIENVTSGNYVDLLDPDSYYTAPALPVRRQRINDNLLGDQRFSPIVRRTPLLRQFEAENLPERCRQLLAAYPPAILKRALSYLYTRETKSSFEIEHVTLDALRTERFIDLLVLAERDDFLSKQALIDLQNRIVDKRFADHDYRTTQNYVGESIGVAAQKIHYVSPKPGDLPDLMEGIYAAHARMATDAVHPVVHAAAIAFGFVFAHPFEDGNGRIHRFLIHNVLARRHFTPPNVIFPVSAAMLADHDAYDAALEAFSQPLLRLADYTLDAAGRMTVRNQTASHYRYIDMTAQTEALFTFIERTIQTDLQDELRFIQNYDSARTSLREIADLPDRLSDLFIRLCLQNNGVLSASKRRSLFAQLSDDEVARMQVVVQHAYRQRDVQPSAHPKEATP